MKIAVKLILNVVHHGWVTWKIFPSSLPKTVFNRVFLPFYLTEKHQICILFDLHQTIIFISNKVVYFKKYLVYRP